MTKKTWEQLKDESDEDYEIFLDYLSLGPSRSIYTMLEFLQYKELKGSIYRLKFINDWESRSKAYDRFIFEQDELKANEELQFIRIKQKKLISLIDKATKLEMLLNNQPSEIIKNETDMKVEFENVDPELIKKLGKEIINGNTC